MPERQAWRAAPLALLAALVVLISACSAGRPAGGSLSPPSGEDGSVELRAQPGDRVALKIFQEEEMSDTFRVGQDGRVTLPKLGSVLVTDQNVATLQDSLRSAYGAFLRNPAVEVTVLRRIGVHGEVAEPGLYLVDLTMTLRDVIAQAGGITEAGDPGRIQIIRGEERVQMGRGGDASIASAELRSGDQVMVGRRPWIQRNSLAFASTAAVVVSLLVPVLKGLFF